MGNLQDELKAALSKAGVDRSCTGAQSFHNSTTPLKPNAAVDAAVRAEEIAEAEQETQSGQALCSLTPSSLGGAGPIVQPHTREGLAVNLPTVATERQVCLPATRDLTRVDWWIKPLPKGNARWALIEDASDGQGVWIFLVNQDACVFEQIRSTTRSSARARLVQMRFERYRSRPASKSRPRPPSGRFRLSEVAPNVDAMSTLTPSLSVKTTMQFAVPVAEVNSRVGAEIQVAQTPAVDPDKPIWPKVFVEGVPSCNLELTKSPSPTLRALYLADGVETQCSGKYKPDQHVVTIGLDFGTSTTKVVIGDNSYRRSFAIPFCNGTGVVVYLLPSRLFERQKSKFSMNEGTVYALDAGSIVHRDLKLAWLAEPNSPEKRARVVAFMALVLRQARGWLFRERNSYFRGVNIVWRLHVGFPAAFILDSLATDFRKLVDKAWELSCSKGNIDSVALDSVMRLERRHDPEIEVDVIPEIAAQIHGFVTSSAFDAKADNRYLLIDIGAGTIDSSLFKVKPNRGGKWTFERYTASVQPNGSSNLHVHRVKWWQAALSKTPEANQALIELERTRFATDLQMGFPEGFRDYFKGIRVELSRKPYSDPDHNFLTHRVVKQVKGETFFSAWANKLLGEGELAGIPMFLCGGGSRMAFYQRLGNQLRRQHGHSWLYAVPRSLQVPDDLECEGSINADYDRLSVAYGLSRIDAVQVIQVPPIPEIEPSAPARWTDRYVDKDQM